MEYKKLGKTNCEIPIIGQGTYCIEEYGTSAMNAVKYGISKGMSFIDTAENYGNAEVFAGRLLKEIKGDALIATKVSPEHLTYDGVIESAERSLQRLGVNCIDLYQIHWPNPSIPMDKTMLAMDRLVQDGKVKHVGVCNFTLRQLKKAYKMYPDLVSIQCEFNLFDRMVEYDILPFCEKEKLTFIAYSPLDKGKLTHNAFLRGIAAKYKKPVASIILKFLTSYKPVIAIPKASRMEHVKENACMDFSIDKNDLELINRNFTQKTICIPMDRIYVDANRNKFSPRPEALARDILDGDYIKPIRVASVKDSGKGIDWVLTEGASRYYAWSIAYGNSMPIQAFVRS